MNATEEAVARAEIGHLQSIYNTSGDRGRIDELLTTFLVDGALEVPGDTLVGHDAIRQFLSSAARAEKGIDLTGSRHHLTTSRIEFETPDVALAWTYFFVMRRGAVIQEGTYIDRFAKNAEGWKITKRRVKLHWTAGD